MPIGAKGKRLRAKGTTTGSLIEQEETKKAWACRRCGKCCKFIVIPVMEPLTPEVESYLDAHRIAYDGKKIIIPAICEYLDIEYKDKRYKYKCRIHDDNFSNCRLGGEKECKEAQKAWLILHPNG